MSMSTHEVTGLVRDLMTDFNALHVDTRFRRDIVEGRHDEHIRKELVKLGYPRIRTLVSREGEWAARKIVGILAAPEYAIHVEPDRDSDASKADKLEMIDANFLLRMDPGGTFTRAIHRHQAMDYATIWVHKEPFALPMRLPGEKRADYNARCDSYRRRYVPMRAEIGPSDDTAFYEDGQLFVTMAVREYEIPVYEFCRDYGKYEKEEENEPNLLVRIWDTQFKHIRAGYAIPEGQPAFSGRHKIKIAIADDGEQIAHYVGMPGERDGEGKVSYQYHGMHEFEAEGAWDNPFGRPSLIVAPGFYNAGALRPEDRYQSILLPFLQSRYNMDFTQSEWASRSAERPRYTAPLPPETQVALAGMTEAERATFLTSLSELKEGRINPVFGDVKNIDAEANIYEEKLYAEQKSEHQQYIPNGAFAGNESTQSLLKNTPTSSILRLNDLEDLDYNEPFNLAYNALLALLDMHDHYWQHSDEKCITVTTGRERRYGKVTPRGEKIEAESAIFGMDKERSILRVDKRASTQLTNLEAIQTRMTMPDGTQFILDEEICTILGQENAEEYLMKVRAQSRYKRIREANDSLTLADSIRRNAVTIGVDATQLLLSQSSIGGPTPPAGVDSGGGNSAGGGYRMQSPGTNEAQITTAVG